MSLSKIAPKGLADAVGIALAALSDMAVICLFCAPSLAEAPESNFPAISGEPIKITADSVEHNDRKRTAVFRGNALATLGVIRLMSEEIYVTYNAVDDGPVAYETRSVPSLNEADREITQIEARGGVLVSMTNEIQAKGNFAILDVTKQELTMQGEVILSQGENLIRGIDLVVDLATGLSKFRGGRGYHHGECHRRFTSPSGRQK
jgi:lipopolysaccharide export system protein LptA